MDEAILTNYNFCCQRPTTTNEILMERSGCPLYKNTRFSTVCYVVAKMQKRNTSSTEDKNELQGLRRTAAVANDHFAGTGLNFCFYDMVVPETSHYPYIMHYTFLNKTTEEINCVIAKSCYITFIKSVI